jgi:hypothetical protein
MCQQWSVSVCILVSSDLVLIYLVQGHPRAVLAVVAVVPLNFRPKVHLYLALSTHGIYALVD